MRRSRARDEVVRWRFSLDSATGTYISSMTPESLPLAILFEDKDLIVVDKPAGMLVHPTQGVKSGTLAMHFLFI